MEELRKKAKELLESKQAQIVIGYGEGSNHRVQAVFIQSPNEVDKLIYDEGCLQNLGVYLLKPEVKKRGKPAIVAPLPVLRTVLQLAVEEQITENDLIVLGISDDGKLLDMPNFQAIEQYIASRDLNYTEQEQQELETIRKLTLEKRLQYWQDELSQCFKCYACRQACALCYCSRCTVECNQPQWIAVPSHDLGNLEWHVMRAMHLAGRCINCGDCARACPLDIPLNLLNQVLAEDIHKSFGVRAGTSTKREYALSTFKPDDKEDFIG